MSQHLAVEHKAEKKCNNGINSFYNSKDEKSQSKEKTKISEAVE